MSSLVRDKNGVIIHGHFYQPPREDPWSGEIQEQPGAHPYHDWNARIAAECYVPNTVAKILGRGGEVERVVNNYSRISFDFGPTLLTWLAQNRRKTYDAILEADRESHRHFAGHGSALAQAYHHAILPLANRRDKETEVIWGLRDFEYRFGRPPEAMWLPETAADLETLDLLERHGMRFVILSPLQAAAVRLEGATEWQDASRGSINIRKPYRIELPSGGELAVFFYHGPISQQIAFGGLLHNGERLGRSLLEQLGSEQTPQLVSIASDGETYGHHHRFGEMALAYALKTITEDPRASLCLYGEFLERHPPLDFVRIIERSSWSCAHGVGRWQRDCGCHTGAKEGWNQKWREPLRESLNWLRDFLAPEFEARASQLLTDPWGARNDYIRVLLDSSFETKANFLAQWGRRSLTKEEQSQALELLELQRHALMMFTSCGWFFNDLSGIETVQILKYAGRAIDLARVVCGRDLTPAFLSRLEKAKSNCRAEGTGRQIFEKWVSSAQPSP